MRTFSEQETVRREKLEEIRKVCNPYPEKYVKTHSLEDAKLLEDGTTDVRIAGRIIFARKMGKLSFVRIRDLKGDMQLEFKIDVVGEERYDFFKRLIDTGDFIGAEGEIFTTQTGEKTLRVHSFEFLGKALRPLPEKFHGLVDTELKYRQRYVDLITNEESRKVFLGRSKFYAFLHKFLADNGFLQVETPIIQTAVCGASAKPFYTHHNALDMDFYLRIATELHLKRLIIGGMEKVYEIGRLFRNEGMDATHNPEFTTVEIYQAYGDLSDMMRLVEELFSTLAMHLLGTTEISYCNQDISLKAPFKRLHMVDAIKEQTGIDFWQITDIDEAMRLAREHNIEVPKHEQTVGHIINLFFEEYVEKTLIQPTILYGHPIEISPLTKKNKDNPRFTDRFELFINGKEYGNAYTELNDPIDQKERFLNQLKERELGNDEANDMDNDFIEALEYGMPPTGGIGIGIDRLVMLLTGTDTIRDVLLFPHMRNKQ